MYNNFRRKKKWFCFIMYLHFQCMLLPKYKVLTNEFSSLFHKKSKFVSLILYLQTILIPKVLVSSVNCLITSMYMHVMSTKNFLWCLLNERIFYSYTRHNIDLQSLLQVIQYLLNPHIDIFLIWLLKFNAMNNGSIFFASIVFKLSFPIFVLIFFINLTNAVGWNLFLG